MRMLGEARQKEREGKVGIQSSIDKLSGLEKGRGDEETRNRNLRQHELCAGETETGPSGRV